MSSKTFVAISGVDSIVTITDVLRPQGRLSPNEVCHQLLALHILNDLDRHPPGAQQVLLPEEGPVLADDDPRDAVEEYGAAAHRAGRQGGVQRAPSIDPRRSPTSALQRVHLAVKHDAPALHAPVAPTPENATVVDQDRADRDTALGQTTLGFLNRGSQKLVHSKALAPRVLLPRDCCRTAVVGAGQGDASARFQCTSASTSARALRSASRAPRRAMSRRLSLAIGRKASTAPFRRRPASASTICSPSVSTTRRRIAFSSSRTLPAHEYSVSRAIVSGGSCFCRPYCALNLARNHDTSAGISSRRSRNGGTRISTTFSR